MRKLVITRPESSEYAPYYAGYIAKVPKGDILQLLRDQQDSTLWLLENLPELTGEYRYATGKWSVKEVLGHVIDGERVFAYRALRIARGDKTPLPGFEQDDYVANGNFNDRPLKHLQGEYQAIRTATIALFEPLTAEAWMRTGTASGNIFSVRALAWAIAGHELHHLGILKDKYGIK